MKRSGMMLCFITREPPDFPNCEVKERGKSDALGVSARELRGAGSGAIAVTT
jgi:hypothetical protein